MSVRHYHCQVNDGIVMQKEPTWPFDIVAFRAPLCRIHSAVSPSVTNDLWITTCLSRFHPPLHALMYCVRIILKYPRLVPVGATEKVLICLMGMDEVFANCDCVLIWLLCGTVCNVLNLLKPTGYVMHQQI